MQEAKADAPRIIKLDLGLEMFHGDVWDLFILDQRSKFI